MDAFKADFPDFKWKKTLEEAVREYVKFNESRGFYKQVNDEIFGDRLIQAWNKATKDFKI